MTAAALALRFVLELGALAALAYGGWRVDGPLWLRLLFAVAAPLAAALIWGRWVAPGPAICWTIRCGWCRSGSCSVAPSPLSSPPDIRGSAPP